MAFTIPSSDEALAPLVQSQIFETDLAILVAALSQTGVVSGCGVTAQGSPDMTVAVASGTILAAGVSVAVTSGNLTVGAADATNPRVDLISASAAGVKTITAGTAAAVASVKPPDLPSGHIGLAFVYVAPTDTAINTNEITDKRAVLSVQPSPSGTSFPGSPSTNDLYFRTDRSLLYFYDGTRWLTLEEYSQVLGNLDNNQPISVNGSLAWGATDLGANGQWITRISAVNYVATTNTGSAYWTSQLASRTAAAVAHNIGSTWDTSADTADRFTKHTVTVGAAVTAGDTHFVITGTKTSAPGTIYTMATLFYRLIG